MRYLWVGKFVLLLAVYAVVFGAQTVDPRYEPEFTYGVRAALAAFGAGAMACVGLIPLPQDHWWEKWTDMVTRLLTVIAVLVAGWYWLLSETNGQPVPYLVTIVPLGALGGLSIGILLLLAWASRADAKARKRKR